jgi:hypothetical protein
MKSVFLINGFLESGKTEFLTFTISQDYFQIRGTTLLLVCEQGEKEYDEELLKKTHTVVEYIEDKEGISASKLIGYEMKYKPERILIEYNGMWQKADLKLPWHWKIDQQVTLIDASTFPMYFGNMRSLINDMVNGSELIIFNRCDGIAEQLPTYKRNIMALNRDAEIIFEDSNGEVTTTIEEELPYDCNADLIELDDKTYGIWFFDMMDTPDRYEGKKVKFLGRVVKPEGFEKGHFVPGRSAMTCCAEDIAFLGFVAKWDKADEVNNGDWVNVTGTVKHEFWKDYKGVGPVLYVDTVEKAKAPKEEVISLV